MARVTVVTDSTAYLPGDLVDRYGIVVVSLRYDIGDGELRREIDVTDLGAFYEDLRRAASLPTTSPPPVEDFVAAYEPLLADGGSVVSVHISSGLSQTCDHARAAADDLRAGGKGGERVHVQDVASTAGTLALVTLSAARAAAGKDVDAVIDVVRQARLESRIWFLLDTLEFLRRGGRIGSAAAWIGSTLNVKPILTIESEIRAVERVRTRVRGIERLLDYGRQLHAGGLNAWMVQHSAAREDADALVERLQQVFWTPPALVSEIGPVIGVHVGPGLIGVGGMPARFLE